jgi:hypothetical protein
VEPQVLQEQVGMMVYQEVKIYSSINQLRKLLHHSDNLVN